MVLISFIHNINFLSIKFAQNTGIVIEEGFSELGAIDRSNSSPSSLDRGGVTTPTTNSTSTLNGDGDYGVDDVMMLSKIKKRLSLVESELELTKHRFSTTQASLQVGQIILLLKNKVHRFIIIIDIVV
jgi:hypothetical protein